MRNTLSERSAGPNVITALMELRALIEIATSAAWHPLLARTPRGDGHPVVVVPAFMTSDGSTALMRRFLERQGFSAYGWEQGRNTGIRQQYLDGLGERVAALHEAHGRTVSLVGWSLGGVYARALANKRPELVRQVITLGSPFNVPDTGGRKVSAGVLRLYEMFNPGGMSDPMLAQAEHWRQVPAVPSTSIYSEGDGIAAWKYCVDVPGDNTENLRVPGSHVGLTHNLAVMYALADRLAQKEGEWRPFDLNWLRRRVFGSVSEQHIAAAFATP